ncbi:hypothetical protein KUTeg_001106 [Tegillarca granosa]|uniref:Uncharacterized protein n=1 Tax=Tegillarca granosa TaxID=220873 RepID=A0ABQ9G059_TEGGR|nr:hypothetical protein KUTeg_001106 [Tegillarca granosa]
MECPSNILEYLDSIKMEARIPREKINHIREITDSLHDCSKCSEEELLSLLGHMNFASQVILPGRSLIMCPIS